MEIGVKLSGVFGVIFLRVFGVKLNVFGVSLSVFGVKLSGLWVGGASGSEFPVGLWPEVWVVRSGG